MLSPSTLATRVSTMALQVQGGSPSSLVIPAATAVAAKFAGGADILLRGGGGAVVDLGRTKLRLEGLSQYGVMTALLMNAALRLFSSTPIQYDAKRPRYENSARLAFSAAVALCVCLGGYTTIVFSLLGLYSKRALGLGEDREYLEFFAATSSVRHSGFESFIWCLITFKTSFLLSIFLNHEGKARWWLTGLIIAFDIFAWLEWSKIWLLAQQILHLTSRGSM